MKLTGAIIIIYACWMLGVDLYKSNIKRLNFTKGLFSCAEFLKTEIVYDCVFLEDSIIRSVPFSGDAASFIECIGTRLEEKGISTEAAFEKAKPDLIKNVSSEVYLLTKELFFQLGEKDCESQEKLISGYLKKLYQL